MSDFVQPQLGFILYLVGVEFRLDFRMKQPLPERQTGGGCRGIVGDVKRVGELRGADLSLKIVLDNLKQSKELPVLGEEANLLSDLAEHLICGGVPPGLDRDNLLRHHDHLEVDQGRGCDIFLGLSQEVLDDFTFCDDSDCTNSLCTSRSNIQNLL